jgi:FKBP-type peptidyl-prolyl cis-trans isomerase
MKAPPAPPPRRNLFWPALALVSLAANLALAVWAGRLARASEAPTPVPASVNAPAAAKPVAATSRENTPYAALGSFMAENNRIADLGWTPAQFAAFQEGFRASYEGRGLPMDDDAKRLRDEISKRVQGMLAADQPNPIEDYFKQLREKEGVLKTASGLHYRMTEPGAGPKPTATDTVVMSFAARMPDGTPLPKISRARTRLAVRDLLPGLAEGVQLLSVGGKALVYVPPGLSFNPENWPQEVPTGMPVVFFVELHEIVAKKAK